MTNRKFYTFFIILNILIIAFLEGSIRLVYILLDGIHGPFVNIAAIFGFAYYMVYMILKLLLPKIFVNLAYKHKNSLISQFIEFIRNNPKQKKFILPIAFCFDLPFMSYYFNGYYGLSAFYQAFTSYIILCAGGVFFFYIMLYRKLYEKNDLNSFLHILNISLFMYSIGIYLTFFITAYSAPNDIIPKCFISLCILTKIFLLYILFSIFEKFFPHSTGNKVAKELKATKNSRKSALLLAFAYDVVIILCCLSVSLINEYRFEWSYIPLYEIIALGGVWMFYFSLFSVWKIQDKLKKS